MEKKKQEYCKNLKDSLRARQSQHTHAQKFWGLGEVLQPQVSLGAESREVAVLPSFP